MSNENKQTTNNNEVAVNTKGAKVDPRKEIESYDQQMAAIAKKKAIAKSKCDHHVGLTKVGDGKFMCNGCKETFNIKTYNNDQIIAAKTVMQDMINQLKLMNGSNSDDNSKELVAALGQLSWNISELCTMYDKQTNSANKKRKKNNSKFRNNDGGNSNNYGMNAIFNNGGGRGGDSRY